MLKLVCAVTPLLVAILLTGCQKGEAGGSETVLLVPEVLDGYTAFIENKDGVSVSQKGASIEVSGVDGGEMGVAATLVDFMNRSATFSSTQQEVAIRKGVVICCYLPGSESDFVELYYGDSVYSTLNEAIVRTLSEVRTAIDCGGCDFEAASSGDVINLTVSGLPHEARGIIPNKLERYVADSGNQFSLASQVRVRFTEHGLSGVYIERFLADVSVRITL